MSKPKIRLAMMWTELSGYINACLKALVKHYDVELDVTRIKKDGNNKHPYDESMFKWISNLRTIPNGKARQSNKLISDIEAFAPHVALVSGWSIPIYRKLARTLRKKNVYIIGCADNPWNGSLRQQLGVLVSPWYVKPMFDVMWVPGERGARFAEKLGFYGQHLLQGLYSADQSKFRQIANWREKQEKINWPKRFFFAGRLSKEKGIDDLIYAYQRYRKTSKSPWELWVAGSGPYEKNLAKIDGIKLLGFVQPEQYHQILRKVGVFVLPSHYDPWPLVIHEMTSAGLPIICSRECGSSVELVQDGYNGFLFEAGDIEALTRHLQFASGNYVDLSELGRRSAILSNRYSPELWANYFINHINFNVHLR